MPPPFAVTLMPHDPHWATLARAEMDRIRGATGIVGLRIHHIGSTAIPGIVAKPVIDLLAVAPRLADLDSARSAFLGLGYRWNGEYGLAGRRYATLDDPLTGERRVQVHGYGAGDAAIARHLAFRDYLRGRPALAADYAAEKTRCAALHRHDSHAYTDCKSAWIRRVEAEALEQS